jgi:hypothetical protein
MVRLPFSATLIAVPTNVALAGKVDRTRAAGACLGWNLSSLGDRYMIEGKKRHRSAPTPAKAQTRTKQARIPRFGCGWRIRLALDRPGAQRSFVAMALSG